MEVAFWADKPDRPRVDEIDKRKNGVNEDAQVARVRMPRYPS